MSETGSETDQSIRISGIELSCHLLASRMRTTIWCLCLSAGGSVVLLRNLLYCRITASCQDPAYGTLLRLMQYRHCNGLPWSCETYLAFLQSVGRLRDYKCSKTGLARFVRSSRIRVNCRWSAIDPLHAISLQPNFERLDPLFGQLRCSLSFNLRFLVSRLDLACVSPLRSRQSKSLGNLRR